MRRRRRYGSPDHELPKIEKLTGPVVGAKLLGVSTREEGIIAKGAVSERWRLTDDINALLMPDDEFIMGGSLREVKEALELRHPSPVPGASMIEICNSSELKRHTMPFGNPVIVTVKKNPDYAMRRWGDKYVTYWKPGPVGILTSLCMGGNDLLVSAEAAQHIREDDDFYGSDLVIGGYNSWYEVVKYRPSKAQARRKTKATITTKTKHDSDLLLAGRELRTYAGAAFIALRDDLNAFDVCRVLVAIKAPRHGLYGHDPYDDDSTKYIVRQVRSLIRIHGALRGKYDYRYNDIWQNFLKAVRDRPKDINDDTWGNYADVKPWLEAESKIKKPKPTKKMIAAREAAEAASIRARTCAGCGALVADAMYLYTPPPHNGTTEYAAGVKFCDDCWESKFNAVADAAEQPSLAAAN